MTKTITTTISDEFFDFCKINGIGWHQAISMGIKYIKDGKNTEAQLDEMQQKVTRLSQKLHETQARLWDLEKPKEAAKP